ncbi:MAG: hypothetical protein RKP20_13765, partial [Candidatus Competibacter sp.]|nr:hypothetical protein [Candidatus Competibacter sp.]
MDWTFLIAVAVLWLVSPIVLLIALVVSRHRLKELRQQLAVARPVDQPLPQTPPVTAPPLVSGDRRCAPVDLENLLLLRLELQRLVGAGALTEERSQLLMGELDRLWTRHLATGGARPDDGVWQRRRVLAWDLLARWADAPLGPPPWQPAALTPGPSPTGRGEESALTPGPSPTGRGEESALTPGPSPTGRGEESALTPGPSPTGRGEESALTPDPSPASERGELSLEPIQLPRVSPVPITRRETSRGSEGESIAARAAKAPSPLVGEGRGGWAEPVSTPSRVWRPAAPSPLEKALQALSGWPKLVAPFLAQN